MQVCITGLYALPSASKKVLTRSKGVPTVNDKKINYETQQYLLLHDEKKII